MRVEKSWDSIFALVSRASHYLSRPAFTKFAAIVFTIITVFSQPAYAYDPEARFIQSCLGGLGRIDVNIVNKQNDAALYRFEFQGQSAREITVAPKDWGRMRFTGRLPGFFSAVLKRNGAVILSEEFVFFCGNTPSIVGGPEVTIMNACRYNNGYILFQMINQVATSRPYIIEFEGVPNRSTTAAQYGQAIRAVTGRPDGNYNYLVRSGTTIIDNGQIEVNCD